MLKFVSSFTAKSSFPPYPSHTPQLPPNIHSLIHHFPQLFDPLNFEKKKKKKFSKKNYPANVAFILLLYLQIDTPE